MNLADALLIHFIGWPGAQAPVASGVYHAPERSAAESALIPTGSQRLHPTILAQHLLCSLIEIGRRHWKTPMIDRTRDNGSFPFAKRQSPNLTILVVRTGQAATLAEKRVFILMPFDL